MATCFEAVSQVQLLPAPSHCPTKGCRSHHLIAKELLAHQGRDPVATTGMSALIVKADKRVERARGPHDKAQDASQETVCCVATLTTNDAGTGSEKADAHFAATTRFMGAGTTIAAIDERAEFQSKEPAKKKDKL